MKIADSPFDLSGKTAIVTGSTRGFGRAIVGELVRHSARIAISIRTQVACDVVSAEIASTQGSDRIVPVSAKISARTAVQPERAAFGPVDIVIGNVASKTP